jgi:hypothetical protein
MKRVTLVFVALVTVSLAFRFWQHGASLPVAIRPAQTVAVSFEQVARGDFVSRLRAIIARADADSPGYKAVFGEARIVFDDCSINAPALRPNTALEPTATAH